MVERRTPERSGGFETYLHRVVSLSKTLYSPKVLVLPRKQWLRPEMNETLWAGTLNLKTDKQTNRQTNKLVLHKTIAPYRRCAVDFCWAWKCGTLNQ